VFIHGFGNTFSDAVSHPAFNREWLAASRCSTRIRPSLRSDWPSKGKLASFPILQADYLDDQLVAGNSGLALMAFTANLEPVMSAARAKRNRTTLLAHSVGNLTPESGLESWFLSGNGDAMMFDVARLRLAIVVRSPPSWWMSGLAQLASRSMISTKRACPPVVGIPVSEVERRLLQGSSRL
jgi:esterase/lipase superfamily enzyme